MDFIKRIDAIASSVSTVAKIAEGGGDPIDEILSLQESIQDFRREALDAKEQTLALREENLGLREQLARQEANAQGQERYQLLKLDTGSYVYALKEEEKAGAVEHYLCVACFGEGRNSMLQFRHTRAEVGKDYYKCPRCDAPDVQVPNDEARRRFVDNMAAAARHGAR